MSQIVSEAGGPFGSGPSSTPPATKCGSGSPRRLSAPDAGENTRWTGPRTASSGAAFNRFEVRVSEADDTWIERLRW